VKWLGECCGLIYLNKYINILRTKITPYLNSESKRKIREICQLVEYSYRIIKIIKNLGLASWLSQRVAHVAGNPTSPPPYPNNSIQSSLL
jgi:hypothetical protein